MSFLIDTNILAYAYDNSESRKREICSNLLKEIFNGKKEAFVSNQILAELFYTLTKNFKKPLDTKKAKLIVSLLIKSPNWRKVNYNHDTVDKAADLSQKFNIPFWDALIVSTMIENNIFTIYTENEKDFKKIPRLSVINLFH